MYDSYSSIKLMNNKIVPNTRIAVIGLGYVGLPLAIAFGKKYDVIGFDIDESRVKELSQSKDRTLEASLDALKNVVGQKRNGEGSIGLHFSSNKEELRKCNTFIVTVPTPIDQFKAPDLGPLLGASEMVGTILKEGDVVIYESTVYPGCTEEDCVPVLERTSGLKF